MEISWGWLGRKELNPRCWCRDAWGESSWGWLGTGCFSFDDLCYLDVSVGNVGSVGESRNSMFVFMLEEG